MFSDKTRIFTRPEWLTLLAIAACPVVAVAAVTPSSTVSLEWDANPEPDVVGYKVYFGTEPQKYDAVIDVPGATRTELPEITLGSTYYLAVSAYNAAGEESPRSAELVVTAAAPVAVVDTSMSFTPHGEGRIEWKYPKADVPPADKFTVYASEDLKTWAPAGTVSGADPSGSDASSDHFSFRYPTTDKPRMFFKVGASNAFGEFR